MENKLLVIGLAVALALGVIAIFVAGKEGPQGPQGPKGESGLGAVVGPEHTFLDTNENGVPVRQYGARFAQGTTTVWRMVTQNATTTPSILCYVDVASSSATVWTLAVSDAGGFATSTVYEETAVAADAKSTFGFEATTTSQTDFDALQIAPNSTWILSVKGLISGADETSGVLSPSGKTKRPA